MSPYLVLLEQYAQLAGFNDIPLFLELPEVDISGITIGLSSDARADGGDIIVFSRLGTPAPTVDRQALYCLMLEANAFWHGTGGCTLALYGRDSAALLCVRLPLPGTTAAGLGDLLTAFAQTALIWRDIVEGRVETTLSVQMTDDAPAQ